MNINSIFTDTLTRKCPLTSSSGSVCPTPHHIHPSDELFSLLAVYELICLSRLLYALREFVLLPGRTDPIIVIFYQVVLTVIQGLYGMYLPKPSDALCLRPNRTVDTQRKTLTGHHAKRFVSLIVHLRYIVTER